MVAVTPIYLVDDVTDLLRDELIRHFAGSTAPRLIAGLPESDVTAVLLGTEIPLDGNELRQAEGIVLLAPSLAERDRVQVALAGHERTWLTIVPDPAVDLPVGRAFGALLNITKNESICERTVGLLGFREVGWMVAKLLDAAGAHVIFWSPQGDRRLFEEEQLHSMRTGARRVAFDELLRSCDAVIVDLPDDPASAPLIGRPELALLRDDVLLVNTTSSTVIDDGALIQALRGGYLRGVALGRTNFEPLPAESPLHGFERVLLSTKAIIPDDEHIRRLLASRAASALANRAGLRVELRRVRHVTRHRPGSGGRAIVDTKGLD